MVNVECGEVANKILEEKSRSVLESGLGPIASDWATRSLDEIAHVTSGKRLPKGRKLVSRPTPFPYIRVTDMRSGTVDLSDIQYVPDDIAPSISKYRIHKDDIFISVAGTLGIVGIIPPEIDGANLTENADRITKICCSQSYLAHFLRSSLIQSIIDEIRTVGAQPKLALTRLRKFPIALPETLVEQENIARALSDVDSLIKAIESLIAKKRLLNQGVAHELLTGRRRLPSFDGKWEIKKLREIAKIDPENLGKQTPKEYEFNYIALEGVNRGRLYSYSQLCFGSAPSRARRKLVDGDILFGTVRPNLQSHFHAQELAGQWVCSTGFCVIRPLIDVADGRFIFQALFASEISKQIEMLISGSNYPALTSKQVAEMKISIPSLPEQEAISDILYDMDADIFALENRREKLCELKLGMTQELLTGRIRLI